MSFLFVEATDPAAARIVVAVSAKHPMDLINQPDRVVPVLLRACARCQFEKIANGERVGPKIPVRMLNRPNKPGSRRKFRHQSSSYVDGLARRARHALRSYSQFMFFDQFDGARLRAFLAQLFRVRHPRIDLQTGKLSAEHAVAVEINLPPIVSFDETEFAERIEFSHGPNRRPFVVFHLPLQFTDLIL